ncbi:hypothetical protein HDU92_004988 [Lobulomyces angularis]|nr:hypothetical protein HDU92_004988 [Lobulomyces angularis]
MSDNYKIEKHTITVTTFITVDKLPLLLNCMKSYNGLFSVTLHLLSDENLTNNLLTVKTFLNETFPIVKDSLDMHLVIDAYPRQFNFYRNVARYFCRTDLILMLDADFIINKSFAHHMKNSTKVLEKLAKGDSVFILPAFEYRDITENKSIVDYPITKEEVKKRWVSNHIMIFQGNLNKAHVSTKYRSWMKKGVPFKIEPKTNKYEPYAIFNKNYIPWCDERFVGYGYNRAAWWYEIYLSGIEFYVLPYDFIFHQYHVHDNKIRIAEKKKNISKFRKFTREVCDKYTSVVDMVVEKKMKTCLAN